MRPKPDRDSPHWHRYERLVRLLLLTVSIFVALGMAEALLRLFGTEAGGVDYRSIVAQDELIGHRLLPDASVTITGRMRDYVTLVRTNSRGFRAREHSMAPSDTSRRILLLGDSEVFGQGVDEPGMLDVVLEALLNADLADASPTYEVINLAIPAIGTAAQERILVELGLDYRPEAVVLLMTVANDLQDNISFRARRQRLADTTQVTTRRRAPRPGLLQSSHLYRFAQARLRSLVLRTPLLRRAVFAFVTVSNADLPLLIRHWYTGQQLAQGWPLTTTALASIHATCERQGIELFVAALPCLPQFDEDYEAVMIAMTPDEIMREIREDPRRPQRLIADFCAEHSITYVELLDEFRRLSRRDNVRLKHPNDGHLNARGTAEIARILAPELAGERRRPGNSRHGS